MYRANKTEEDIKYILDNLRHEDEIECKTLFGENWKEDALKNIINTEVTIGKTKDGDIPVVMGGVHQQETDIEGVGTIWLLCTEDIKKHIVCLLKELSYDLGKIDEKYWLTYNFIYGSSSSKKWLKKLGFKFDNPRPQGLNIPEGFEFFYRVRPVKGLGE
jgi:hypothetical protein